MRWCPPCTCTRAFMAALDDAEVLAKCIAAVEADDDTTTTVTVDKGKQGQDADKKKEGKDTESSDKPASASAKLPSARRPQALTLTRSDVPMSQWDNVTEWGPDVQYVEQARAETQQMPQPQPVGSMPDGLKQFVTEIDGLRDHDDAPLLDAKDEAPAEVKAWQEFAQHMQSAGGAEAYMQHIKDGGSSADFAGHTAAAAPAAVASGAAAAASPQAAADPLADGGPGNLFWDIVQGRVDMTPPPVGQLGSNAAEAASMRPRLGSGQASQGQMLEGSSGEEEAAQYPPQCPIKFAGAAKDQCVGSGEGCELCLNGAGYCKPTGSEVRGASAHNRP